MFQIGDTVGALVFARPLDKHGFTPLAIVFVLALPIVGSLGFLTGNVPLMMFAVFFAGFCLLGLQLALNAASALLYPTAYRANGAGWAFAVGRVGSVAGPVLGGILIAMKLALSIIFLLLIPIAIGTIASIATARLFRASFGSDSARTP